MPRPRASPSPPPGSFSFSSFEYPYASPLHPVRSRVEWARYINSFQERDSRASAEREDIMPPRPAAADNDRRRPAYRAGTDLLTRTSPSSAASSAASSTTRPRATPSERYLRPSHARRREPLDPEMLEPLRPSHARRHEPEILEFLRERARRRGPLDPEMLRPPSHAHRHEPLDPEMLESLRHNSAPNRFSLLSPSIRPHSPRSELDGPLRQTKRRKLDHDIASSSEFGFRYGYKGQVVAGRLKMDIMSCDGGEYEKHSATGGLYKVQNVLKNDKSVYCSESSRCNLLLKHIGETPFCLEKVVIRAPDRGFTAPVQEGLVFVSMSPDELLSGTSAYQIQYCPHPPLISPSSPGLLEQQPMSIREALEDSYILQHSRPEAQEDVAEQLERLRHRNSIFRRIHMDSSERLNSEREERREPEIEEEDENDEDDVLAEHCEYTNDDLYTRAAGVSAPTPPPFTVTTVTEEEESDSNEEPPSPAIMADRLRRESRWRPDSDEEEEELPQRLSPLRPGHARLPESLRRYVERRELRERNGSNLEPIRAIRLGAPSRIEPSESTPEAEGLIAPHARFFIAKNKNKITIKFHPAVSGKYVLLKLWSPTHDGNIDIESVQFYGYSGPRFFPATQPR